MGKSSVQNEINGDMGATNKCLSIFGMPLSHSVCYIENKGFHPNLPQISPSDETRLEKTSSIHVSVIIDAYPGKDGYKSQIKVQIISK